MFPPTVQFQPNTTFIRYAAPSPRFGASPPPADSVKNVSKTSASGDINDTSKPKQASASQRMIAVCKAMLATMVQLFKTIGSYLWPPNWRMFHKEPQTSPSAAKPTASDAPQTEPLKVEGAKGEAASSLEPSTTSTPPKDPSAPGTEKPPASQEPQAGSLKRAAKFSFRMLLNLFHISAAAFILIGAPFLHVPLGIGIATVIGVTLVQKFVGKMYPDVDVLNKEQMAKVADKIMEKYDKLSAANEKLLQKIPIINRCVPLYQKISKMIRKTLQTTISIFTTRIIHNGIKISKPPDSSGGMAVYILKLLFQQSLRILTIPFGHFGELAYQGLIVLFRLQDAHDMTKALTDSESLKANKPSPDQKAPSPEASPATAVSSNPEATSTAPDSANTEKPSEPDKPASDPGSLKPAFS